MALSVIFGQRLSVSNLSLHTCPLSLVPCPLSRVPLSPVPCPLSPVSCPLVTGLTFHGSLKKPTMFAFPLIHGSRMT
jgi:hypothetical protein